MVMLRSHIRHFVDKYPLADSIHELPGNARLFFCANRSEFSFNLLLTPREG